MVARPADAVQTSVGATGLLDGPGVILLLCSAGRDSHCLLDVAVRLRGPAGVRVLHVDHGLRAEAADDAAQLAARGTALGVDVVVREAGPRPSGPGAGNLHAWARAARARLAGEEAAACGAAAIATAHTRTDLVETAVARLATQPGRRGLLAMRAREGRLVRPLLAAGVTRDETASYCRARELTWREDSSNADPRYERARIRHGVLPVLRALNPRAEDAIARTLTELAEEREVLDALVAAELAGDGITPERLAGLPAPLARLVLRELCERAAGVPCPRAAGRLADVLALGHSPGRPGRGSVDVGEGARVELRGGRLRCVASQGPAAAGG